MDMYLDGLKNMQRKCNQGIYLQCGTDMLYVMFSHITKKTYNS